MLRLLLDEPDYRGGIHIGRVVEQQAPTFSAGFDFAHAVSATDPWPRA